MTPELDGRGGGYGKFAGKTIGEIREVFERCETDGSMRSVSIVLRVAREQLDARGNLGHYPVFAGLGAVIFALSFAMKGFLPADMQAGLPKLQIGLGAMTVALCVGVFITSRDRKAGLAQERAIVELSLATLEKIMGAPGFNPKPLDFTQELTLKKLVAGAKASPAATLLEVR
jgi:hypothetical protein